MRAALLSLLIAGAVCAAPAPRIREAKVLPQVVPGTYSYEWMGDTNQLELKTSGQYIAVWYGIPFYGFWKWDSKSRTLYIWESCDEYALEQMESFDYRKMDTYNFKLDSDLKVVGTSVGLLYIKPGKGSEL